MADRCRLRRLQKVAGALQKVHPPRIKDSLLFLFTPCTVDFPDFAVNSTWFYLNIGNPVVKLEKLIMEILYDWLKYLTVLEKSFQKIFRQQFTNQRCCSSKCGRQGFLNLYI
jgi:hypothetical protein